MMRRFTMTDSVQAPKRLPPVRVHVLLALKGVSLEHDKREIIFRLKPRQRRMMKTGILFRSAFFIFAPNGYIYLSV
jgi:hypothetical protein